MYQNVVRCMSLACTPAPPRIDELIYFPYFTIKPFHPQHFAFIKHTIFIPQTQENLKKTKIYKLYNTVKNSYQWYSLW